VDHSPDRAGPPWAAEAPPRARRRRLRAIAAAGALTVAVVGGLTAWSIASPGPYGQSRDGCVTVSVPSSTGGALQHGCGGTARAMCRAAFAGHDRLARATRPQCRLAGIAPPARPSGG
jgi:hypothetical protein